MSFIVKNTTFPSVLDLLAPHSCRGCGHVGEVVCKRCKKYLINSQQNICPICKKPAPSGKCPTCNLPSFYTLGAREGLLANLIYDLKFDSVRSLAPVLADLLDQTLPTLPPDSVLVPLPTSTKHIRNRGLDHIHIIAKHLAKTRKIPLERLLVRNKNSVQVGADSKTRKEQANLAYNVKPNTALNSSKTYILFDDIWTTGASMQAAIKKLRDAGASKIIILLLSVSEL